jgi:hypothetical protein
MAAPLLDWLLSAPFGNEKLALLVLCMVGIYGLSAQLAWRMGGTGPGTGFLGRSWFGRWLVQVLRLVYYVGVPLVALWRGALDGDFHREMGIATTYVGPWDSALPLLLLGLGEAESVRQLSTGVAIGGASLGALLAIWTWYGRAVLTGDVPGESRVARAVPWWGALREALYAQLLWALYRAFAATLTTDRLKVAFTGLAVITASWVLDPRRRHALLGTRGYLVVQDWLFALFTAFLSLTVRALWFLVAMHVMWMWFSSRLLAHLVVPYDHQVASTSGQP